jgi:hypothetical protein
MKQFIGLFIIMVLPALVQAQFTYTANNGAIIIIRYTGAGGVVTIPGTIKGLPVAAIGVRAFFATSISQVFIPDSVISIGPDAFSNCGSLTNVTLGSGVTNIGDSAFALCAKLKRVNCRGNAPSLVNASGSGGPNVFRGTLATVYYLSGTTGWGKTLGGRPTVLWNPPVPFTYTTNSDGITLTITGYNGSNDVVSIPSIINFLPITAIGDYAFYNSSSPTSITIPNGVISIGSAAFFYCNNLTNITIPGSITSIGGYAFDSCFNLMSINVAPNNSVFSSIAGVLFNQNQTLLVTFPKGKVGSYTIPNTVTEFEEDVFGGCRLTSITIPNSITNITEGLFSFSTSLTNVTIPDSVTTIGRIAFAGCSGLVNIMIPKGVTSIGDYAFSHCGSLTNVMIVNGVTSIGYYAFDSCTNLTSVTIPNSVTDMGFSTFANCVSLTSVIIPNRINYIGDGMFANCTSLKGIYFYGNAPGLLGLDIFSGAPNVTVYYLPGTTGWNATFADVPTAPWFLPNPTILNFEPNFGVQTNNFGFTISWATNVSVVVVASTNLIDWQPVQTNTLTTSSSYFSDPQWTNYPARFYRLRSP